MMASERLTFSPFHNSGKSARDLENEVLDLYFEPCLVNDDSYSDGEEHVSKPELLLRLDLTKFHYLLSLPPTKSRDKPMKACKVCYDKSANLCKPGDKRKWAQETQLYCVVCGIPLCLEPCFHPCHKRPNYVTDD